DVLRMYPHVLELAGTARPGDGVESDGLPAVYGTVDRVALDEPGRDGQVSLPEPDELLRVSPVSLRRARDSRQVRGVAAASSQDRGAHQGRLTRPRSHSRRLPWTSCTGIADRSTPSRHRTLMPQTWDAVRGRRKESIPQVGQK